MKKRKFRKIIAPFAKAPHRNGATSQISTFRLSEGKGSLLTLSSVRKVGEAQSLNWKLRRQNYDDFLIYWY